MSNTKHIDGHRAAAEPPLQHIKRVMEGIGYSFLDSQSPLGGDEELVCFQYEDTHDVQIAVISPNAEPSYEVRSFVALSRCADRSFRRFKAIEDAFALAGRLMDHFKRPEGAEGSPKRRRF